MKKPDAKHLERYNMLACWLLLILAFCNAYNLYISLALLCGALAAAYLAYRAKKRQQKNNP